MAPERTQRNTLLAFMGGRPLARARELQAIGVSAAAISRAVEDGAVIRVSRGLYQLNGGDTDINDNLAEVAKRAPNSVVCLTSALAFHGLTDQLPRKVWIAIGAKDWAPRLSYPPIRIVRFREPYFSGGVETRKIAGVEVNIYSVAKSIADAFRNPKLVDRSVAIECLKSALADRKATVSELAQEAQKYGAGKIMRPYLEALTANG